MLLPKIIKIGEYLAKLSVTKVKRVTFLKHSAVQASHGVARLSWLENAESYPLFRRAI